MAGDSWRGVKGRPGLNPLRFYYKADRATMDMIIAMESRLDHWITQVDDTTWYIKRPGLDNSIIKYVLSDEPGITTVANEEDAEGNINSIRDAKAQADMVIVQLHCHESDPDGGISVQPRFVPPFARACIDAGADIFVAEGSHADFRGIEVYKNRPIFYDPGDLFRMSKTIVKFPYEYFYWRLPPEKRLKATISEASAAFYKLLPKVYPPGGIHSSPMAGAVVAVCSFGPGNKGIEVKLHPVLADHGAERRAYQGVCMTTGPEMSEKIISYVSKLSAPFGTKISYENGVGIIRL
jgi:hypothetical protein